MFSCSMLPLRKIPVQAGGMPPDSKAAFKAEWEALEVKNLSLEEIMQDRQS